MVNTIDQHFIEVLVPGNEISILEYLIRIGHLETLAKERVFFERVDAFIAADYVMQQKIALSLDSEVIHELVRLVQRENSFLLMVLEFVVELVT